MQRFIPTFRVDDTTDIIISQLLTKTLKRQRNGSKSCLLIVVLPLRPRIDLKTLRPRELF